MKKELQEALLKYIGEFFVEYVKHETAFVARPIPREIFNAIELFESLKVII